MKVVRLGSLTFVVIALAAGAAFAGARSAATDPAATIAACANDTNGVLRLVSGAEQCRQGESFVSWPAQAGGGALAFGHLTPSGLDVARSSNIASVTLMPGDFTGYCVELAESVAGTVRNVVVQQAGISPYPRAASAELGSTNSPIAPYTGCPDTTDAYITTDFKWSSPSPFPVYVLFN